MHAMKEVRFGEAPFSHSRSPGCLLFQPAASSLRLRRPGPRRTSRKPTRPGLGEIMTLQQMRHTKLWLAGEVQNWDLAAYELDELGEGFDDVVRFHPTHKESPVAPKDAIPRMITVPLMELRSSIEKKDTATFEQRYDKLTAACNSCHEAMNFTFNVVQRPVGNPYPNQVFAPVRR